MKRQKTLTKRERKALAPQKPQANAPSHIHCIACGRHIDQHEFERGLALLIRCDHGSQFPSCAECEQLSRERVETHDRTGKPVETAGAWH